MLTAAPLRPDASRGSVSARYTIGLRLHEAARDEEAAQAGDVEAMVTRASTMEQQRRQEEAEFVGRTVAEVGHIVAMSRLTRLLYRTGRPEEAEEWQRRTAEAEGAT